MKKVLRLTAPFTAPLHFRKVHGSGNGVFRKAAVLHRPDDLSCFFPDPGHEFAVGAVFLLIHFSSPFLDGIQVRAILLRPQIIDGRDLVIGKTQQLENTVGKEISFQRLAQDMEAHMDFAVLQLFDVIVEICHIIIKGSSLLHGHIAFQFCFFYKLQNRFFHVRYVVPRFFQVSVFVHGLFQFLQFIVGTGIGYRRRHVADKTA